MLKIILAVALLLALLVAVYVGYRVREWALCRRTGTALAQAEGKLRPLVFTGSSKYDRTAAALLAQTRWFQYDLNIFRHVGKTPWLNREAANLLLADVDAFFAGKDVLTRKRGVFLKAYVSEIDDALVTYSSPCRRPTRATILSRSSSTCTVMHGSCPGRDTRRRRCSGRSCSRPRVGAPPTSCGSAKTTCCVPSKR
jgi:hypothetical protein